MLKQIKWAVMLVLIVGFAACGKEEDPPPTKTQLLTSASWKFKSASVSGVDITNQLQACQKDNVYTFNSSGSSAMDEGATKCNAADPQSTSGTWSFASNETIINLASPLFTGGGTSLTVVTLSETELIVSFPYTPPLSSTVTVNATFTH
jgi:hypothetical protein